MRYVFFAVVLSFASAASRAAPPRDAEAEAKRVGAQWVTTFHFLDKLADGVAVSPSLPAREPLYERVDAERKNPTTVQHPWGGEGPNKFLRVRVRKTDRKQVMRDLRDCLAVPLVGKVSWKVDILPHSELRVATDYVAMGQGRATLRVVVESAGQKTAVLEETAATVSSRGGPWVERSFSLAAFGGKSVTVSFEVDDPGLGEQRWKGRSGHKGVGLFGVPRIVTRLEPGETATRAAVRKRLGDEINRPVLAIFFDSFRADLVPPVREERKLIPSLTPNLDRFFGKAVRFSRTFSVGNQTRTGSYGFLTSLPPSVAGWWQTRWEFEDKARDKFYGGKIALLTQELRQRGYLVGMMGYNGFLHGGMYLSLDMGFDFVQEFNGVPENTVRMTDGVMTFLDQHKDEKVFLLIWYEPPHFPYSPPPGYAQKVRAAGVPADFKFFALGYLGKMIYGDEHFGRLFSHLEKTGILNKSMTFITGDHGECMDPRHQGYSDNVNTQIARMHGKTFFDEEVHIPFALRMPGALPEDRTVINQVSLIDVGPTVLELLGLPTRPDRQLGRSFAGLARGGTEPDTRWAYFEGRWSAGFREGGKKYIFHDREEKLRFNNDDLFQRKRDGVDEIYDVQKDPFELKNLASGDPALRKRVKARYEAIKAEMVKFYRGLGFVGHAPQPLAPLPGE